MPKWFVCVCVALTMFLAGCSIFIKETAPETTEAATHGSYEFAFSVEQLSGDSCSEWEFVYTYDGETISSGHQILFSLEIFTFHSIRVDISEKGALDNTYSATFPVAICAGGAGKTEVAVTGADGKTATFKITCQVTQIGKQ